MTIPYKATNPGTASAVYDCNQFTIPKLSESGYVIVKSANEIEVFRTSESQGATITQEDAKAKVYKACDSHKRWIFKNYVLPTLKVFTRAAVRGAVEGTVQGAIVGGIDAVTEGEVIENDILLYECNQTE